MNNNLQLLNRWMENFRNNVINNNILLLVFKNPNNKNPIIDKKKFEQVFFEDMNEGYYQLSSMNELDNIDKLQKYKGKKNIIVFGCRGMDIDKITDTSFEILLFFNPQEYIFKYKTFNDLLAIDTSKNLYIQLNVIKKRNPIEIIKCNDSAEIYNFIKFFFHPKIYNKVFSLFQSIDILKSDRSTYRYSFIYYLKILSPDIHLLVYKRILTARLAIAIYKVSTLKFHDNNTIIGIFFRKRLGVKSKTYQLPYEENSQRFKVYDLDSDK